MKGLKFVHIWFLHHNYEGKFVTIRHVNRLSIKKYLSNEKQLLPNKQDIHHCTV